ncbi:hypothetical protein AJ78_07112 [Emergomyces pasteurianus Ep9510]|uniref:PD-(D/E)XK nuclease-like domain-containing protein n=1 Tax=Emergomyces pasteurianus Ep9510 TaxID=1447872 RepID=A0A1J9Q8K2_9EURO|nr:hypothetical protein AJ78_07112 [Emergomyces pasteurianus Ep9510]
MGVAKEKRIQRWIDEANNALFELEESFTVSASKTVNLRLKTSSDERNSYFCSKQQHLWQKKNHNKECTQIPASRLFPTPKICRELMNLDTTCIMNTRLRKRPGRSLSTEQAKEQEGNHRAERTSSKKSQEAARSQASRKRKAISPEGGMAEGITDYGGNLETHHLKSSSSSKVNFRWQLRNLEIAKPSVKVVPFAMHTTADFVSILRRQWAEVQSRPVSQKLRANIQREYPFEFFHSERTEPPSVTEDSDEDSHLAAIVTEAYNQAGRAYARRQNEEPWERVAEAILHGVFPNNVPDVMKMIEAQPMQYQDIASPNLLPRLDHLISRTKIDIGIFFNQFHPEVCKLVTLISAKMPNLLFSPAKDATDSPQLASVEVKSPDGSGYASSLQLVTWLAAGLQQLKELREQAILASEQAAASEEGPLHSFGISVVGHHWLLFVAVKNDDDEGDVNVYGPSNMGDTLSCEGILRIIRMLQWLKEWGETQYWPWLVKNFFGPLLAGTARDLSAPGVRGGDVQE